MREIKFRAWDKEGECWIPQDDFIIDATCGEIMTYCLIDNRYLTETIAYTLMQYTGLKDMNGVEIYEGDVVKHHDDSGCPQISNTPKVIEWWNGMFCFDGGRSDDDKIIFGWWIRSNEYSTSLKQLEIIGNIYENPEMVSQ